MSKTFSGYPFEGMAYLDLNRGHHDEEADIFFPDWHKVYSRQRDYEAEKAGY